MTELHSQNAYWSKRADASRRVLMPTIGAFLLITNGLGILELSELRDSLAASTSLTCHSNLTAQKTNGRYPKLYFAEVTAEPIVTCSNPMCSYLGWGTDVGKTATVCLSGDMLVSVEVNGVSRRTPDGLRSEINEAIWWRKIAFGVGLFCLGLFVFMERNGLVWVFRGEEV